jgi:hypothetical protein
VAGTENLNIGFSLKKPEEGLFGQVELFADFQRFYGDNRSSYDIGMVLSYNRCANL